MAVDTPANLTAGCADRKRCSCRWTATRRRHRRRSSACPASFACSSTDGHEHHAIFEIDSEPGRDVRRDLARAVVGSGFGLLELRPMRMSLEEMFLSLTTEEQPVEEAHE